MVAFGRHFADDSCMIHELKIDATDWNAQKLYFAPSCILHRDRVGE